MGTIINKLNKLAETKSAIKTSIVNKGVSISDTDTFASYASKIDAINGGGTPTEGIYGVFIYDTNGNLTKPEEWDTANNDLAVGVAVIDENCSFVIGKTHTYREIEWSRTLSETIVHGILITEDPNIVDTDYAGEANSSVIRGLTPGETNAFNWAYSNTITVGGTTLYGYIGALGEWKTAFNNKSSINSALSKIGGTAVSTSTDNYHWTSDQFLVKDLSSDQYLVDFVGIFNWGNGKIYKTGKANLEYARAFYHLDYPQINDTVPHNEYKLINRPNQPITKVDFDCIISCTNASYPRFENIKYNAKGTTLEYLYRTTNNYTPVGSITINAENCSKISHLFGKDSSNKYSIDDYLEVHINTSDKLTDLSYLYCYTGNITISNTSKVTNFKYAFAAMNSPELKEIDTSKGTNFSNILATTSFNLIKIAGLSLKSLNTTIEHYYLTGYNDMINLRYALLKDFGTKSGCTSASFTYWKVWGIEDETIPLSAGARQSLIDTLITYSYDRATAGYSTCTITLYADTKALLTENEIAQMTAKGYTLA